MRRVLALIAVLAMVAGPPFLLLAWGFTDWGAIHVWSATDVRVLLGVLTVVGWLAWAVWMVAFLAELAIALSGRPVRVALPGLGLPRAVASALITTILASGAASAAHAAPPVGPTAPVVATQQAVASVTEATDGVDELAQVVDAPTGHTHTVTAKDDLWSLAERYYGEGARWRTIVEANPALQSDPMARLVPGSVLSVPDPVHLVTVKQGDTLSALALTHLGQANRWPEIHALNAHRIADPDLILPGWVLRVPLATGLPDAPAPVPDPAPGPEPLPEVAPELATQAGPAASGATAEAPTGPTVEVLAPEDDTAPAAGLLGGMTALSAAAVIGGIGLRRRVQAHARPLGRRYVQPTGELSRYEAALGRVAPEEAGPARVELLARAMRLLSRHWWEQRHAALPLVRALVGPDGVEFVFGATPGSVPAGFTRLGDSLAVGWSALRSLPDPDHPVAYPGLVTLGEQAPDHLVMVDIMAAGVLGVSDADGTGRTAGEVLSAMLVELACAPWAGELDLLVVTADPAFADAAGDGRIACDLEAEDGVATVERLVRQRGRFMSERGWDSGRLDPDLAEAWAPQVVLFEVAPDADQLARLEAAIVAGSCGVAAVAVVDADRATSVDWLLSTDATGSRRLTDVASTATAPDAPTVRPQTVPTATREALTELHRLANSTTSEPADWWGAPSEDDMNIIALRPVAVPTPPAKTGPRLNLLGPVELVGCTGPAPKRAVRQLVEYCAWLLLHPGRGPQQMGTALLVAEGTRRSNMSRLRTWLGTDPAGELYLPDAYSGRIHLHDQVSSDWEELLQLTAGGVNRLPLERLLTALELVRGAPLADASPTQWGWAEEFRSDAAALIRDIGVVAARAARERGDLETSRWAANRALAAAPEDELLLAERIRTEHAAGRTDEVQRLVARVTHTARVLGLDLLPETVDLCQEVVEGRVRARA